MIEYDLEDYLEEVKYQMTEWDGLDEEIILNWENEVRHWVETHEDRRIDKYNGDITLYLKDEEIFEVIARKYYRAIKDGTEREYWMNLHIVG